MRAIFRDREEAGKRLAQRLLRFGGKRPLVLGLPRGGVPVAFEVARALDAPLDVAVVRKIGAPGRPELGLGAVGEGGARYIDEGMMTRLGLTHELLAPTIEAAEKEGDRSLRLLRKDRSMRSPEGRTVILVDDGIATGGTMRAAIQVARLQGAREVVVAVPVAGPESLQKLAFEADEIVCAEVSPLLWAVGLAYQEFEQVPVETVRALLLASEKRLGRPPGEIERSREVSIDVDGVTLEGDLTVPAHAAGLVIFVHGSGSSRGSHRNKAVARHLQEAGFATLLFNLLSRDEAGIDVLTAEYRYDLDLIARRTVAVVDWTGSQRRIRRLPKACFGASTGAAGAFVAAAERPAQVAAVVSRGGRPDLASGWLPNVRAPCLLLVGERDEAVLAIHSRVIDRIGGRTRLVVVHDAGHLFEEPGAIEEVARRTTDFLRRHLVMPVEVRP